MSAIRLFSLLTLWKLTSSQSGTPTNFVITTTSNSPGSGDGLTATYYWQTGAAINSYECTFTPSSATNTYECNSAKPWTGPNDVTSTALTSHYMKFQHDSPFESTPIEIERIVVTLDNALTYTMETFCIHSKMSCTLGLSSTTTCDSRQWNTKDKYGTVKFGADTNLELIYIDWKYNVTGIPNFANIIHEGSVRPPIIKTIGVSVQGATDITVASVQWDNMYYKCSTGIIMPTTNADYSCTVDNSVLCHGVPSDFWVSLLNPAGATCGGCMTGITHLRVIDETDNTYTFSSFCEQYFDLYTTTPNCTGGIMNNRIQSSSVLIGFLWPTLKAFIAPEYPTQECIFKYPNDATPAPVQIEVLSDISEGWDTGLYGGTPAFECPPTPDPTSYPTYIPTSNPTTEPTNEPTWIPTHDPTNDPTTDPTNDPTSDPTTDPTADPTSDPTVEPTMAPTKNPISPNPTKNPTTADPSTDPSAAPSKFPTVTPTKFPTVKEATDTPVEEKIITRTNIFWAILALAIFLCCCFICVIFIYMKRNKEDDEDDNKQAPMVAAAAYATYHKKEDTYNAYECGAINTAPSMLDAEYDDMYGGQYEAKQTGQVELAETKEEEIDTQYTLDGQGGATGGGTGDNKGDDKVLDMLADGHETGSGAVEKTDTELNPQEKVAFNI